MAHVRKSGNRLCPGTAVLALAASVFVGYPAVADQPTSDCVVTPGEERPLEQQDTTASVTTECDGVLRPAPVGDTGLVEPAPEKGRTPVIEPEEIPARPLPGNDPAAPSGD